MNEILTPVVILLILAALALAYRRDIRQARYFNAMRRAAAHPFADRDWHHKFALRHGLFWKPCPCCHKPFGGHEMLGKSIPHPDPLLAAKGNRLPICPECAVDKRNPGTSAKDFNGNLYKRAAQPPAPTPTPTKFTKFTKLTKFTKFTDSKKD